MFDVIIKNGTLIDGTGAPMRKADVGIKEDKIASIGNLSNEKGELEIDASDRFVMPGFIDVNNHSDTYWQIFLDPNLESLLHQGITTIIGGNCGSSLAPLADPQTILTIQKWANVKQLNVDWLSMEEFLDIVSEKELSVNFGTLAGHGTLRRGIMRDEMRSIEPKELAFVEKMLTNASKQGALGMSSGLVYTHARSTSKEELLALAKIIKKFNGVYVTHVRGEREDMVESVKEALEIAVESGVKLHISHLKVMGEKNWHLMDEALFLIGAAREKGVDVTFDVYPYTNTGTVLYTLLPEWVTTGGKKMMLSRLRDRETRSKVVQEMRKSGFDFSKIMIAISSLNKTLARKSIVDIAESQEKSVEEALLDVLIASEGRVIVSMEVLSQENIEKALLDRGSLVASNGSGYSVDHAKSGEVVHPRSFGTFPRIFSRFVMGKKIISWEEAVRKMTSMPAEKFGISKRGILKEGYFADIVVMDREKIRDLATPENPYQYSQGINALLVNGSLAVVDGKYTGKRNGKVIKR